MSKGASVHGTVAQCPVQVCTQGRTGRWQIISGTVKHEQDRKVQTYANSGTRKGDSCNKLGLQSRARVMEQTYQQQSGHRTLQSFKTN